MSDSFRAWSARRAWTVVAAGLAMIGCADLNVPAPSAVVAVLVSPDTLILRVGDTARVKAAPLDATAALLGQRIPVWTSSAASVATVNDTGLVRALAPGSGQIVATADGIQGHAVLLVSGVPAAIAVRAGNGQSAAVNAAVAVPPAVKVTDGAGNAVPKVPVTFAVASGGGSVGASGPVMTGLDGIATATAWTLGPSAGANTLTATASGNGIGGNPVTFSATATVGPPSASQSSVTASPATIAPSNGLSFSTVTVTVRDTAGSTISGATVALSATGTGNLLTQPTATTDNQGRAFGAFASSAAGSKTISALVNGTVAVTQTDTVLVSASAPAGLGVATQPAGAVSNGAFTTQPAVEIRDAFGNPVPTATDPITVTLVAGNGTLVGPSFTVSAVSGRATFSGLLIRGLRLTGDTLGTGPHALQFSAPGYAAVRSDTFQVAVSHAYNVLDVYTRNCTGCHAFTYANSVNQPATFVPPCTGRTRIVPGDTVNSVIYEKVRSASPGCGVVMPTTGLMSVRQIRLIRDWIVQGALNN